MNPPFFFVETKRLTRGYIKNGLFRAMLDGFEVTHMIEMHLKGIKARNGKLVFVCSTCRVPPSFAFGAQDKGELVYLMCCPKCEIVLGEWDSLESRDLELREFARTLKLRH